jgi:hypothetical protein
MNDLSTKAKAEHDSSEVSQQALIQSLPQQVAAASGRNGEER